MLDDIRDIKGPVNFQSPLGYILAAVIAALIVLAVIAGIRFLLIRRKAAAPAKKPHEVAYERIEVLRRGGLIEKGKVKEFFYELSGIIRSYIEARFGIHAPEMTTEEFLQNVREAGSFTSDHKSLLKDLLSKCDLVKYAKYGPVSYEIETMLEFAVRFIDQTKPEEPEDKPGK